MEEYVDAMKITGHGDPISFKRLEELKVKAENATCKINAMGGKKGTGFFFVYNIKEEDKYFLITNNHVLDLNWIKNNNYISITYWIKKKKLD